MSPSGRRPDRRRRGEGIARSAVLLIGLGLWVLAIYLTYTGVSFILRQQDALRTWVPVRAVVVDSECRAVPKRYMIGMLEGFWFGPTFEVLVSYRYNVGGKEHTSGQERPWFRSSGGDRLPEERAWSGRLQPPGTWPRTIGQAYGREEWAKATVALYVPGSPCQAYYDPANPSQSFLLHDYHFSPYEGPLLSVMFFVSGLIIVLALLTDRRTAQGTTLVARAGPLLQAFGHVGAVILFGISGWALWHYFNHAGHTLVQSRYPLYFSIWLGFFLCTYLFMIAMRLLRKSPVWATNTPPIRTDELGLGEDGKGGVWRRIVYPWET
jgi:hypothetical protein